MLMLYVVRANYWRVGSFCRKGGINHVSELGSVLLWLFSKMAWLVVWCDLLNMPHTQWLFRRWAEVCVLWSLDWAVASVHKP